MTAKVNKYPVNIYGYKNEENEKIDSVQNCIFTQKRLLYSCACSRNRKEEMAKDIGIFLGSVVLALVLVAKCVESCKLSQDYCSLCPEGETHVACVVINLSLSSFIYRILFR